jgi:hypothetical protein
MEDLPETVLSESDKESHNHIIVNYSETNLELDNNEAAIEKMYYDDVNALMNSMGYCEQIYISTFKMRSFCPKNLSEDSEKFWEEKVSHLFK